MASSNQLSYTQCPQCQAKYRITPEQIKAGLDQVKCSKCQKIFQAMEHLHPPLKPQKAQATAPSTQEPAHWEEEPKHTSLRGLVFGVIIAIVLSSSLVGQYLWFMQRDWVLQHPQIRPVLESLCATAHCSLPATRDPQSFVVRKWAIKPHEQIPDAVTVHIHFANQAAFAQAYPWLELTFSDENGQAVGMRRFTPNEYLADPKADQTQIEGNGEISITLHLKNVIKQMHDSTGIKIRFL